jgi:hypothetical protein
MSANAARCTLVRGLSETVPMRNSLGGCCARTAIGNAAAPPINEMNSRRLIAAPGPETMHRTGLGQRRRIKLLLSANQCPL